MSTSKKIYIIHGKDADQHLGSLKHILEDLKKENRIAAYTVLKSTSVEENSFQAIAAGDMVILMLTNNLEAEKTRIEKILIHLKEKKSNCKIAEIIVDNIPYAPQFIAFPADLQPIRAREDMDTAWQGIESTLKDFFPVREGHVEITSKMKKILFYSIAGVVLAVTIYWITRSDDEPTGIIEVSEVKVDQNPLFITTIIEGKVTTGVIETFEEFYVDGTEGISFEAHFSARQVRAGNEITLRVHDRDVSEELKIGDRLLQYGD